MAQTGIKISIYREYMTLFLSGWKRIEIIEPDLF